MREFSLIGRGARDSPKSGLDVPKLTPTHGSAWDHALSCHYLGLYNRRNALRKEFANLCKKARLKVELEVKVGNQGLHTRRQYQG